MFNVLLYYCFSEISGPEEYATAHRGLCEDLGLLGRIIIAAEGINGTVSGTVSACEEYMRRLSTDFPSIEFKVDRATQHAFKALHVRHRAEIISLGAQPQSPPGKYLSPVEWLEMMRRDDVILLDGRNAYESEVGHFRGAICPPVQNFRGIPEWLDRNRAIFKDKNILTYCTGGIRCEKLSAWMRENGFENVFQLHGGIVSYGHDEATQGQGFDGVNVVFDERVAVSAGSRSRIITTCRECGVQCANYVNCANVECNLRMIQCEACEETTRRCCSEDCRTAPRQRAKGKRWHESRTHQGSSSTS